MFQAYTDGVHLSPAYHFSDEKLSKIIKPIQNQLEIKPVDALFNFENGKVVTFRFSQDGKTVDTQKLKDQVLHSLFSSLLADTPQTIHIKIPLKTLQPEITDDKAGKMGIKEEIATGTSLFQHSIENRIYNISLAAARINGTLIAPGETFSFAKTVGDISVDTGYRQAYVIENGKTVLGDGGGVCQVSTTLFRAALNAGLPIVERHPHAYRVGYYEQNSGPGIDAAVYVPSVDMKFKNDTGHYILIQSYVDLQSQQLTFSLYGTKDNREVVVNQPIVTSETPAPETKYQDDPTLPKGELKQVDFSAAGANVYFTRQVKKDGKIYLSDKFVSNYRPWQAIFLRGTKE
jgi:vancomycin resistance protein YoaR